MTGTNRLTLRQLEAYYRKEGALGIGSHYIVDRDGHVHEGRPVDEHPNVHPQFNKNSIAIEVMCSSQEDMTEVQKDVTEGMVEYLKDQFPNAEELNHIL